METTLLASAPSLEMLKGNIRKFFCMDSDKPVTYTETAKNTWSITTHKPIEGVRVRKQRGRYRFEML